MNHNKSKKKKKKKKNAHMTTKNSVCKQYRTSNGNLLDMAKKLDTSTSQQHTSFEASQTLN